MIPFSQEIILVAIVFATSIVGAITGAMSLVNVPVLMMMGIAPRVAVATNMFAVTFLTIGASIRFRREKLTSSPLLLPLCGLTLITSALGAQLTAILSERAVMTTVGVSMVALIAFMLINPQMGEPTPLRRRAGWLIAAVLGVYGGVYSGGYTTLLTFLCVAAFGTPLLLAVGLTKVVNMVSCVAATLVFARAGLVDFRLGAPLAASMLVGGWLGAQLAITRGQGFVRALFLVVVVVLAAKLLVYDLLLR